MEEGIKVDSKFLKQYNGQFELEKVEKQSVKPSLKGAPKNAKQINIRQQIQKKQKEILQEAKHFFQDQDVSEPESGQEDSI